MERNLPPNQTYKRFLSGVTASGLAFVMFLAATAFAFAQNVDLAVSNLTVTAGDETNFIYSFDLTNNGSSEVLGYNMKLTFSMNGSIDGADYFNIVIPADINSAQWIGPAQTLPKTEHYYATVPSEYLPSGVWNVILSINYDNTTAETDYTNNITVSSNTLTVAPYQITLTTPIEVNTITDSSFVIHATFDAHISRIYYKVQLLGTPAPDEAAIKASKGLFPWEIDNTVTNVGPAYTYDIYSMAEAYDGNVTAIYNTQVTTTGTPDPTIISSASSVYLPATAIGESSLSGSFKMSGYHLTENVIVTPSPGFLVSKDDIAYADQVSFLPADFESESPIIVFVKSVGPTEAGMLSGGVTCTSAGAKPKVVTVSLSVYDPKSGDFDGLTSLNETGWRTFNVRGNQIWSLVDLSESSPNQRVSGENMAIQIDGSTNGTAANEDWLISPVVDLSSFQFHPTIRFKTFSSGPGMSLALKYSANYSGYGDPRNATWIDADVDFPAVNSGEWKESFVELLLQGGDIRFAFVYTSSETEASRWTLDDWRVTDNLLALPTEIFSYNDVELGTSSSSQSFLFETAGYGDVTITASEPFELSLDNDLFTPGVTIPGTNGIVSRTIYVRFTPVTVVQDLPGTLTFTANDLSLARQLLVGSSLSVTATEKGVRTTGFIYPNPTTGPVNVDLNNFEDTPANVPVWIANSMGSTVASFEAPVNSLSAKLSDIVTNLAPGLYYVTINTGEVIYRNKVLKR